MTIKKVLVTGMSGLIGKVFHEQAAAKYSLSALNRRAVDGVECHQADIRNLDEIETAFRCKDVVVHLAALAKSDATWEEALQFNVVGTYNVFEAARRAGVKRVIYASSGATVTGWEREPPYNAVVGGDYDQVPDTWSKVTHETPARPAGLYGWSKIAGEALARYYCDAYGMSMICLRIGRVNPENHPTSPREFSVWSSYRDIVQMIEKCIDAPETVRFDVFYAVSNNKWSYRDTSHAAEIVGYKPEDEAEQHRSASEPR